MGLDVNMMKNQIVYEPSAYGAPDRALRGLHLDLSMLRWSPSHFSGQYVDPVDNSVWAIADPVDLDDFYFEVQSAHELYQNSRKCVSEQDK